MNSELKEFLEWTKTVRRQFEIDMDETWLTKPPIERVKIENILIAYDQMADRLRIPSPSGGIKTAELTDKVNYSETLKNELSPEHIAIINMLADKEPSCYADIADIMIEYNKAHNQFAGDGLVKVEDVIKLLQEDAKHYKQYGDHVEHRTVNECISKIERYFASSPQNTKESL